MATLKNAIINITVCMNRIDNELKERGASTSYFKSLREKESPELLELATIRE
jgi:hypothetical protein